MDNGDVLEVRHGIAERRDPVESGITFVDALGVGDVVEGVLPARTLRWSKKPGWRSSAAWPRRPRF